jgi:hypothetical protein
MVNFSTPPGLEGLFDLDRKGVDIRPTLLRVLTDQYLRTSAHTPDEDRHYTELAMRLIDETDIATRAAVSVRLAPHAFAPRSIMLQLACDVLEVAEPVLLHSPVLTPGDCEAIIRARGAPYAEILARRTKPAAAAVPAPEPRPAPAKAVAPVPAEVVAPAPATSLATLPIAAVKFDNRNEIAADAIVVDEPGTTLIDDNEARELTELFFAASGPERRQILLNLDYADWSADDPPVPLQRADIWRMETAALRHHTANLMHELERALGISFQHSRRIVEDEFGEPIVAAAKAMGLPADVLQRIVLFMNPRVGQSVDRVYELSALYRDISVEAAQRLVAIMRAAVPSGQKARDARPTAESIRRSVNDLGRVPSSMRDARPATPPASKVERG